MTIHELKISGFGKHCDLTLTFSEGVNIICGNNESGKSTILAYVRALLYGLPEVERCVDRKKYLPWKKDSIYGGSMTFEHKGILYNISAIFAKAKKDDVITLYNVTSNEEILLNNGITPGELVLGISEDVYDMSSFASQLASKLNTNNEKADALFTHLMKEAADIKSSYSDTLAGKRLLTAKEAISSPQTGNGLIEQLCKKKASTEDAINKVNSAMSKAEGLRNDCYNMQQTLNEEKDKHLSFRSDMSEVTKAVETVSLHGEVKSYVNDINILDDELAAVAKKTKHIRIPLNIVFSVLIIFTVLCLLFIIFTPQLEGISFLSGLCGLSRTWHGKFEAYLLLGGTALLLLAAQIILSTIIGKKVRFYREELFSTEEALAEILKIEYINSAKKHFINRENINAALEKHRSDYKRAKIVLENEDNKNQKYNEHLALVEDFTEKIAYSKASADALNKSVNEMADINFLKEELDDINYQINVAKNKYAALLLAEEAMDEAYQRWQSEMGPIFGREAGNILNSLTDGKYNEMRVARNFEISLKNESADIKRSYNYSGATVDQMYLALRMALVKSMSTTEGRIPLILDDPFVQYDKTRKQLSYDSVASFSKENNLQIIMTTCIKEPFYDQSTIIEI